MVGLMIELDIAVVQLTACSYRANAEIKLRMQLHPELDLPLVIFIPKKEQ